MPTETQEKLNNDEQLRKLLVPDSWDFWLCINHKMLWRVLHWNWFNIYTGENSFWAYAKHWFREYKL